MKIIECKSSLNFTDELLSNYEFRERKVIYENHIIQHDPGSSLQNFRVSKELCSPDYSKEMNKAKFLYARSASKINSLEHSKKKYIAEISVQTKRIRKL